MPVFAIFWLKKSFITGTSTLQPLYLLCIHAILIPNWGDFGMVSVNAPLPANCKATFAGRKASGFGIEGGDEGIFEYLNSKYINLVTNH